MFRRRFRRASAGALVLCMFCPPLPAATFCVESAGDLATALTNAAANDEQDEIRIRAGEYLAPAGGWQIDLGTGEFGISLAGGYDDGCNARAFDAAATILDGGGVARILTIATSQGFGSSMPWSRIEVSGLTFQNGLDTEVGALKISDPGPIYGGHILVEGNIFRANRTTMGDPFGAAGPALLAATDGPDFEGNTGLVVRNNVFLANTGPNASAAFAFSNNPIELANNTFVANRATDATAASRVAVDYFTLSALRLFNNIFWDNFDPADASAFDLRVGATTVLRNNNLQRTTGSAGTDTDTTGVSPAFVDAAGGDLRLQPDSPMIDTGLDVVPMGLGARDAAGAARLQGAHVDRGAFETEAASTDRVFADGFEAP